MKRLLLVLLALPAIASAQVVIPGGVYSQTQLIVNTTTRAIAAIESNATFTDVGDADGTTFTLPAAAPGLCYSFIKDSTALMTITAGAGDVIRVRQWITAAAGSITSSVIGDSIRLCADDADDWHAVASTGTSWGKKIFAPADDAVTPIYTVSLPTADTGCAVHTSFTYQVTNGTDTASHSGIYIWSFVNQNGTVTGVVTDSGEASAGTGCGNGCDTATITAVGTVATANIRFNNTLTATGSFSFTVLNDSCGSMTVS